MDEAEFFKVVNDEKYAHLFLDLAMTRMALRLAKERKLKRIGFFEWEHIRSQGRLIEQLEKLDLSDEAHLFIRTYGPDAYLLSPIEPANGE
ncbi:hypothetical protein [uncultured Imperialibacter sp.]|uniref:hypothetical protein n=1 Tax=Imperialibacter sp. TaxID=2038411 RepID=UPI0030D7246D|tara:strand:- start:37280 stop:37552 length:273 start_codon:yes stop_codon:yes gene_type:complete